MSEIIESGKLDKTLQQVRASTGNDALAIEFDLFSIANMPAADCTRVTSWMSNDGYEYTMRNAFSELCAAASGKAWLARIQKINASAVSAPQADDDVTFTVAVQDTTMNIVFLLRTENNLYTANGAGLAAAIKKFL